jgi:hypothetical protein
MLSPGEPNVEPQAVEYPVGAMTRPIGRRPLDAWFATISKQNG